MTTLRLPLVDPIQPVLVREPFNSGEWTFDFKYDGFRGIFYCEGERSRFISKQGKAMPRFDALVRHLVGEFRVENAIFDGEIVVTDASGRPIFKDLLRDARASAYVPFDLLWLNDHDLRVLPLSERRKLLRKVIPKKSERIKEVVTIPTNGIGMFTFIKDNDLEGMIAKRLRDPYRKRIKWYKIKNPDYSQLVGRGPFLHRRK